MTQGPVGTDETPEDEQGAVDEIRAQADAPPIDRDGDGITETEVGPLDSGEVLAAEDVDSSAVPEDVDSTGLTLAQREKLAHIEAAVQAKIDETNARDAEAGGGILRSVPDESPTVPNPATLEPTPTGFNEDGLASGPENVFAQREPERPIPSHPAALTIGEWSIPWQRGPVAEVGANGVQADQVLTEVIRYLQAVNVAPFNNRYTSLAVTDLESAQNWLARRTAERMERGVEGTSQP